MPKTEISIPNLQQCRLFEISPTEIEIRIRQHNYFAGILNLSDKVFYAAKRTSKNVFRMFNGLGLNSEILSIVLPHFGISKIVQAYENELLVTTAKNWFQNGVLSPYSNEKVDRQLILPFAIMIPNATGNEPKPDTDNQLSLFDETEVANG